MEKGNEGMGFDGFSAECFGYLLGLAANNSKEYFLETKGQYEALVREPMLALDEVLSPVVMRVDPRLQTGKAALSRMYRDTRFSKNKDPMHDYSWLMYKPRGEMKSEYFGLHFSVTPVSYSYGIGCYAPKPEFMKEFFGRIEAMPDTFRSIVTADALKRFSLSGSDFKRPKRTCDDEVLNSFFCKKYFYLEYNSNDLQKAASPAFAREVSDAFEAMAPLYAFIHGI